MYTVTMATSAAHPDLVPGSLVKMFSGEWSSARSDVGIVIAMTTTSMAGMKFKEEMLVLLPQHPTQKLIWHTIDDWHLKNFWTVLWHPGMV